MILKLIPHHTANYKRLIEYVLKDGKGLGNTKPEAITHNLRGATVSEWVQQFQRAESLRLHSRHDQVLLTHEVLSFNKLDSENISKEILADFANEYIQQRGIEGLYVVAIHQDTKSYHVHACVSGVKLSGMANRLSKTDLRELKQNLQQYHQEKFPVIKHSSPQHGNGKEYATDREYQARQRDMRALHKKVVEQTVAACFTQATSQEHFLTLLQEQGLLAYERSGKPQGVWYEDRKYRFTSLHVNISTLPQKHTDMKKTKTIHEIRTARDIRFAKWLLLDKIDREKAIHMRETEYRHLQKQMEYISLKRQDMRAEISKNSNGKPTPEQLRALDLLQYQNRVLFEKYALMQLPKHEVHSESLKIRDTYEKIEEKVNAISFTRNELYDHIEQIQQKRLEILIDYMESGAKREDELRFANQYELCLMNRLVEERYMREPEKEKSALSTSLTARQLQDVRQELDRLYMDKNGVFIRMTHEGLANTKLAQELDTIIQRETYLLTQVESLTAAQEVEKRQEVEKEHPYAKIPNMGEGKQFVEEGHEAGLEAAEQVRQDMEQYSELFIGPSTNEHSENTHDETSESPDEPAFDDNENPNIFIVELDEDEDIEIFDADELETLSELDDLRNEDDEPDRDNDRDWDDDMER